MQKTKYMTCDEMAKIFVTPVTTHGYGNGAFIWNCDFYDFDNIKNNQDLNHILQEELDKNRIKDRKKLIDTMKDDLSDRAVYGLAEKVQRKIIKDNVTTYDDLLKIFKTMDTTEQELLKWDIYHAERMSAKPPKDYKKLVLQFQQALSDKSPEANNFINNLRLFITAFHDEHDYGQSRVRAMRRLADAIHDKEILYNLLQIWEHGSRAGAGDILKAKLNLIFHKTPYGASSDIFLYVAEMDRVFEEYDSNLFKRGLKLFYQEINEEATKRKPNFDRLDSIRERYQIESKLDFDLRVRIVTLEAENKKLKAELKKIKTKKLETGIANVIKKSNTSKSTTRKPKTK